MTGLDFSRLVGPETAERPEQPQPVIAPIAASASSRVFAPTSQQEAFISALISTDRNITLEALAGCLAADTIIGINRRGKSYEITIANLVHMFNGGKMSGRKFDPCIPTTVRSVNRDGIVYLAEIVSAVFSGIKPTYRVATAGGFFVLATAKHQFLTPDGWVRLDWLTRNDHLICDFGKTANGKGPKRQYRRLSAMGHHPYAHSSKPNACAWAHRLVVEAHMNGMSFEEYVKAVRAGDTEGLAFLSPEFHIHHRDNDPSNNDLDNLEILPAKEHWKHHGNTDTWQNAQAKTKPDRVIEIVPMGLRPTYDLEMKDPDNPCFLANKIAVHNSGKTSSILLGVDAYLSAFPSHELIVCAYNKSIQLEVDAKLKARGYDWRQVGCQTVHSMGMSLLRYVYRPEIDEHKTRKLIDARRDTQPRTSPYWAYGPQIRSLVSCAKQAAVGFFPELPIGDRSVWYELADHYDVDFDGTADIDQVVTCAMEVYRQSLTITDMIDFDDMVLFPLVKGIRVKYTKDLILGDESQDWSRARQALVRMFMRQKTGRLVVVGDTFQAIYGWTGADSEAMSRLTSELDAITLPLSVTWRCPKAVVKLAQTIVPDIQAAPDAIEGQVLRQPGLTTRAEHAYEYAHTFTPDYEYDASGSWLTCEYCGCLPDESSQPCDREPTPERVFLDDLTPGHDAILCRNNAPLVPLAYALIRLGIPAKVEGRKIGEGLQTLVNRWQVKSTADLLRRLDNYRARETQKALAKNDEAKSQEVEDRVDTLREIIREVNRRGKHDIESVLEFIDRLFADGAGESRPCVTLASYHKSKGREWDRVILIEHDSRCPSRAARQEWQKEQERHLAYVSFTRAKQTLVFAG